MPSRNSRNNEASPPEGSRALEPRSVFGGGGLHSRLWGLRGLGQVTEEQSPGETANRSICESSLPQTPAVVLAGSSPSSPSPRLHPPVFTPHPRWGTQHGRGLFHPRTLTPCCYPDTLSLCGLPCLCACTPSPSAGLGWSPALVARADVRGGWAQAHGVLTAIPDRGQFRACGITVVLWPRTLLSLGCCSE